MKLPRVLYAGPQDAPELQAIVGDLHDTSELACTANICDACNWIAGHAEPDLIVVAQFRPETSDAFDSLRRAAPLAGLWVITGSWCEGEQRTAQVSPLGERVPWLEWQMRWNRERQRWAAANLASWQLPSTVSLEERVLRSASVPPQTERAGAPLAIVCSAVRDTSNWLRAALEVDGWQVVCANPQARLEARSARLAIVDADEWNAQTRQAVRDVRVACPEVRLLLLLGFPRVQDEQAARAEGVATVLAKPLAFGALQAEFVVAAAQVRSAS